MDECIFRPNRRRFIYDSILPLIFIVGPFTVFGILFSRELCSYLLESKNWNITFIALSITMIACQFSFLFFARKLGRIKAMGYAREIRLDNGVLTICGRRDVRVDLAGATIFVYPKAFAIRGSSYGDELSCGQRSFNGNEFNELLNRLLALDNIQIVHPLSRQGGIN